MKNLIFICIVLGFLGCNLEKPTQFTTEALQDTFTDLNGNSMPFEEILTQYKGQTILIDVWASWCQDCIVGMPIVKKIQKEFPNVVYLFLSEDRTETAWKRGIQKYKIEGEHYFMTNGPDGPFADFLNSNWIPRYMVIDKDGKIKLYKAKSATDKRIKEALQ